jgi:hypothetical protein
MPLVLVWHTAHCFCESHWYDQLHLDNKCQLLSVSLPPQSFALLPFHRTIAALSSAYRPTPSPSISFYAVRLHIFGMFGEDVFNTVQPSSLFSALAPAGCLQHAHWKRPAFDHMMYDAWCHHFTSDDRATVGKLISLLKNQPRLSCLLHFICTICCFLYDHWFRHCLRQLVEVAQV